MRGIHRKPAARLLGYAETGTPDWFAMRRDAMTGSRIAAALGLSPWVSPFTLFFQFQGLSEESQDTPAMEWGRRLESVVVRKYADDHPWLRLQTKPTVWQNIERPWQVCSPDALVVEPGVGARRRPTAILEVKTSRYDDEWGVAGTDAVPVYYRCQALWMLDTLGLRYCHFGVLFSGSDYREYTVEYDQADVDILRRGAVEFLDRVARGDRPDIDGSDSTYQTIRAFHPNIDGSTVELPPDLAAMLEVTQSTAREAEADLQSVRSSIAEFMGSAKVAEYEGRKYADRRSRGGGEPYVQLCSVTPRPTLSELREAS